jgi:DUF4097 and DUF4098 domain-containing protein YvlB
MWTPDRQWHLRAVLALLLAAPSPLAAQHTRVSDLVPDIHAAIEAAVSDAPGSQRDRGDDDRRAQQAETVTRTVRLGPNGELDLSNVEGDVSVVAGSGDEVRIEATKRSRARSQDEARRQVGLVEVSVVERPGRVEVRTEYPRGQDIDVSVTYAVVVPASTRTLVNSVSGDVRLQGTTGDARLVTVSGDVHLDAPVKVAALKSVSGSVNAANLAPDARLSVSLVSGDLTLDSLRAQSLEAETVSGDLVLQNVTAERVSAQSVSGDLEYSGSLVKGGRYELTTHSGGVTLTIPDTVGFELNAETFSGNVQSDMALSGAPEGGRRGPRQRSVRGTHGDGSAVLDLTTFSGNIVIRTP